MARFAVEAVALQSCETRWRGNLRGCHEAAEYLTCPVRADLPAGYLVASGRHVHSYGASALAKEAGTHESCGQGLDEIAENQISLLFEALMLCAAARGTYPVSEESHLSCYSDQPLRAYSTTALCRVREAAWISVSKTALLSSCGVILLASALLHRQGSMISTCLRDDYSDRERLEREMSWEDRAGPEHDASTRRMDS